MGDKCLDSGDTREDGLRGYTKLKEDELREFSIEATTKFFKEYGLVSHQLNSYNDFIKNGLQKLFDSLGDLIVEPAYDTSQHEISEWRYALVKFGKIKLDEPSFWFDLKHNDMYPKQARLQNMTYSSRMKANVSIQVYTQQLNRCSKFKTGREQVLEKEPYSSEEKNIIIGKLPVMIKSDLCRVKGNGTADCEFDLGGYFLIKGAEKVFIAQEQICMKRLWVQSNPVWMVGYKSEIRRNKVLVKLMGPTSAENMMNENKCITVYFSYTEVPIWILFFALDVSSDRELCDMIDCSKDDPTVENILIASIREADEACPRFRRGKEALNFMANKIRETKFPPAESIEECISNFLFPKLQTRKQKAHFLAYMVKCLLLAYTGQRKCDVRENFKNKRFDLAGVLIGRELRVHILHARKRMTRILQKDLHGDHLLGPIEKYFDASIITNGLSRAFSTGSWVHPYKRNERTSGVVANLRRTNPLQAVVDCRKTRQQVAYTGRVGDARYPHPSHWGRVCFLSTPDDENCGLVKNLSITGLVSTDIVEPIVHVLLECGMEEMTDNTYTKLPDVDKVLLNGEWIGVCKESSLFVSKLRYMRRNNQLHCQVEIKWDTHQREIRIFSDAGRILRPLMVVDNLDEIKNFKGESFTFQSLVEKGIIELIGTEEEEDCCTAWGIKYLFDEGKEKLYKKYSHCELDMSFLLGLSCGIIPFANHNHARRVMYQAQKHSQQAMGYSSTCPDLRVDTLSHQLYYPQKPLFATMASDCMVNPASNGNRGFSRPEFFNGQVSIVAVNVHLGYNQEDSLVMNRASLERGMFRSEHIRSYKAEVDNNELPNKRGRSDRFLTFGKIETNRGNIENLEEDGFPWIGAAMRSGDIIIGRRADTGEDHSIKLKHTEEGMVQKIVLSANDEGKNFAVVSLRQVRSPCLGDKFSSMHGQKGVVGYLESQENFPFTAQGIVPDVVINPHAFPSRQTPGQLLESALAKGFVCGGKLRYATPFSTPSVDDIMDQLHRCGFSRWGHERVYNGRTGEMVKALIFMGPTFYQRLVHMAVDKVKFRNTGPIHPVTRQPVSDRKRFGGIKFGEMERDCLLAHGASANLHERLFTLSDSSQMHICTKCKNMANVILRSFPGGRKIRGPYCRVCASADDIVKVGVPYGAKLLYMELFSMGILLKFDTRVC